MYKLFNKTNEIELYNFLSSSKTRNLKNLIIKDINFDKIIFSKFIFEDIKFEKVKFYNSDFKFIDFVDCVFQDCYFEKVNFNDCYILNCEFNSISILESKINDCFLIETFFSKILIKSSIFTKTDFLQTNLTNIIMKKNIFNNLSYNNGYICNLNLINNILLDSKIRNVNILKTMISNNFISVLLEKNSYFKVNIIENIFSLKMEQLNFSNCIIKNNIFFDDEIQKLYSNKTFSIGQESFWYYKNSTNELEINFYIIKNNKKENNSQNFNTLILNEKDWNLLREITLKNCNFFKSWKYIYNLFYIKKGNKLFKNEIRNNKNLYISEIYKFLLFLYYHKFWHLINNKKNFCLSLTKICLICNVINEKCSHAKSKFKCISTYKMKKIDFYNIDDNNFIFDKLSLIKNNLNCNENIFYNLKIKKKWFLNLKVINKYLQKIQKLKRQKKDFDKTTKIFNKMNLKTNAAKIFENKKEFIDNFSKQMKIMVLTVDLHGNAKYSNSLYSIHITIFSDNKIIYTKRFVFKPYNFSTYKNSFLKPPYILKKGWMSKEEYQKLNFLQNIDEFAIEIRDLIKSVDCVITFNAGYHIRILFDNLARTTVQINSFFYFDIMRMVEINYRNNIEKKSKKLFDVAADIGLKIDNYFTAFTRNYLIFSIFDNLYNDMEIRELFKNEVNFLKIFENK